jgi:hypothetical protein
MVVLPANIFIRSSSIEMKKRLDPGSPLAPGATAKLIVDAAGLVTLGAHDVQAAGVVDLTAQTDVGAATSHVGRDRHVADGAAAVVLMLLTGVGHDVRFALVLLGVEHLVIQAMLLGQPLAEGLAFLDAGGAHEHGSTRLGHFLDLVHDGVPLRLLGEEDQVVLVVADHRAVGGDADHVQPVDLHELGGFGDGGAGHAGQSVVELEEVLQGDGGQGLGFLLDLHAVPRFLGFHRLVQAVRPLATDHQAPGEFINDHHFAVAHHILTILLVDRVGPQGVVDQVVPAHVVAHDIEPGADDLLGFLHTGGRHGRLLLFALDHVVLQMLDLVGFLLVEEVGAEVAELADNLLDGRLAGAETPGLLGDVAFLADALAGLLVGAALQRGQLLGDLVGLHILRGIIPGRAGDDQRSPGFVDEDRVDLVHDAEIALLLHLFLGGQFHVVAEVVEAELTVGAVDDIAVVGGHLQFGRLHVERVDGPDVDAELVERGEDPVAVALDVVVRHGDHVALHAFEHGEEAGQRSDDRLALPGLHLGDLAFAEHRAADELHIERAGAEGGATLGVDFAHRFVELRVDIDHQPALDRLLAAQHGGGGRVLDQSCRLGVELLRLGGELGDIELVLDFGVEDVADADVPIDRFAQNRHAFIHGFFVHAGLADLLAQGGGALGELRIGQGAHFWFQRVDALDAATVGLDQALVARAEDLREHLTGGIEYGHGMTSWAE